MKESKFKLVALDMDGTTYESLGNIVEENIEPINNTIKNGVKIVFVTGRPVHSKINRLELFNFDNDEETLFAGFNGALIFDITNNLKIDEQPISKDTAKAAFDLLKLEKFKDCNLWAYTTNPKISYISKDLFIAKDLQHEVPFFGSEPIVYNDNLEMYSCYKFLMFNGTIEFANELRNLSLEVAWTEGSFAGEVTKKGINKKYALEFLSKKYSIRQEEILAIGDGANDIPMFEFAGHSIAPANAHADVKKKAIEVSDFKNTEGVVAKALKKYILGEN
ncbi:Cof-type HAD-IIB family hydrolase [Spiroplasma taiwanense]|uniref:HAD family hydrolase n=1 Tax=Spiroplasma taiwanense CT-1 TaxID=1276220 RepID=S5MAS8_9MOLU|nr:HAD family hydrolase [Spiroplasma taiwanense]AGR40868.1 HAD family hydrolase [Spiroplasma taiwanense CT-1]